MIPERPRLTIGVEEEYFVVDRSTRDLVADLPDAVLAQLEAPPVGMTSPEFLRSQIEIGTPVSANVSELSESLAVMRRFVSDTVEEHGLAIISASTHPFAIWGTNSSRTRRGTGSSLMRSKGWCAGCSSAGCTYMSRSRTRTCESTS
jgi:gamma-glutamyl:cysteine ligase YbdK (ATP-grasp superfamily)